ncbi:hypothetical protein AAFF_G00339850 [Aldrovandia affinis]|uniref:C2H2 AKAP95-type domain-containing protein n=1 Tax=Aldrovandia affinis TaxID=143900 RepID=A0AAD7SLH9_9TELE|nr:hypothetical protein AAFF_G00339850 [Aldrovandia affinis]
MDSSEHPGYEGYDYYNTGSSNAAPIDPYAYSGSWEAPKPSGGPGAAMSGDDGGTDRHQQGGGGGGGGSDGQAPRATSNSGKHTESPDSIIAKINQRLDLLSKDKGGKESQESSFRFDSFQSYMPADNEPYHYGEDAGGGSEGTGGSQSSENHSAGRRGGGAGRRGTGGSGGNRSRGGGNRGGEAGIPSKAGPKIGGVVEVEVEVEVEHAAPPPPPPPPPHHTMMGGRYPPYQPYGAAGGLLPWQRPSRKRARSERDGRKMRGGSKNADGRKKRRQTESDGEESEHNEEDNGEGDLEKGTGEEFEKKKSVGGEEEDEDEPKRKSRGRRSKEKQQKERSKMLFVCSLCKFRTPKEDEIHDHLEGRFHKDIISFLETQMPEGTAKFLQEYTVFRNKKILKKRQEVLEKEGPPQKPDHFRDLAQDEFCKRIEAAHCMACDMIIPGQRHLVQQHLASKDHLRNRKAITDQFKMSSVQIARSILSNKNISDMMEKHLKGEDPFTEEAVDQETHEEGAAPLGEGTTEKEGETEGEGGVANVSQQSAQDIVEGGEAEGSRAGDGGAEGEGEEGEGEAGGEDEEYSEDDLEEEEEDEEDENPMA